MCPHRIRSKTRLDNNMKEFKIRASSAHKLLTNGRGKSDEMGQTGYTYLQEWMAEQIYGYKKEIKSKYLDKGLFLEDEAISFYSENRGLFLLKNTDLFEDDYFRGTPDVISDVIYDFKCSFDSFTFPLFDTDPEPSYVTQLQVYMHLTRKTKAKLIHVLIDTPEHLVKPWEEAKTYTHVDPKYRIKEFDIDFDPSVIEKLKERVILSREYIKGIWS